MSSTRLAAAPRPVVPAGLIVGSLLVLALTVVSGAPPRIAAVALILATFAALLSRSGYISWRASIAGLILIILFIPIRRYTLPVNLPFQLEPYRIYVALLLLGGLASLLVDRRTRLRRTGFEGPLTLIVVSVFASIAANPGAVARLSSDVNKKLMFFLSFVLIFYLLASVIRQLADIDYLTKMLVGGGAVVAFFALIEARFGFNVFNHLSRVVPFLHGGTIAGPEYIRFRTNKLRVFASAEHPIALSAALVVLIPLAIYLAHRYRQRRWALAAFLLGIACASTVSRTGILMLAVVAIVFLLLRPKETRRLWWALLPALAVVHFAVPGTLGAIRHSFSPPGGLVAEQKASAHSSGSGRIADLGPALKIWQRKPLAGQGYGTQVVNLNKPGVEANVFDDQWLGTLLETGALGFVGWLWFFVRAIRRFGGEAKRDPSPRGWLLTAITASVAAYAVGMLTYDAFSFIQVTFLLFILVAMGSSLVAEHTSPFVLRAGRPRA
jgi:O-antigen ligase/polysaccharide polymerase Wzy-like membrane protein